MANVAFKRGLHASLPTTAQSGCFYLTTDTNRLYIGNDDGKLVDLNKYIKTVSSIDELTALSNKQSGDFAYISTGNILAVYDGTKWIQINQNTNTDRYIDSESIVAKAELAEDNSKITVTLTANQNNADVVSGGEETSETLNFSFDIPKEYLNSLAVETNVDLAASSDTDGVVNVKTTGVGSSGTGINLKEGSNVSVSVSGADVTISATDSTYALVADAAGSTVGLKDNNSGGTANITFKAGEKLAASVDAERNVTYSHTGAAATAKDTATETVANGGSFTVLKAVETDSTGHVSTYTPVEITLPTLSEKTVSAVKADKDGKITVTVATAAGGETDITSGAELFYTVGQDSKVTIYNGNDLGVYTAEEIDKMMVGLNAMVYKGTITSSLPTEEVKIGYTYMVETAGTYNGVSADVGDLFIANGTEGADGFLSTIEWDYVPSGDDTDTQYGLTTNDNKVVLKESNAAGAEKGSVTFAAGNDIEVSTSTAGTNATITVTHETFSTSEQASEATDTTPGYGGTFKVVDEIVADNGHVTGYKTKTITLPASDNTTYTYGAVAADNGADLTLTASSGGEQTIKLLEGTDILIDASGNEVTVAHTAYGDTAATEVTGTITDKKFKAVNSISVTNGHVTGFELAEFTMPTERSYELSGGVAAATNGVTLTNSLTETTGGGAAGRTSMTLTSESLKIASDAIDASKVSVELEWGSF